MHIGYFTIEKNKYKENINWDWLDNQTVIKQTTYVRLIELKNNLKIIIDGHNGNGVIKETLSNTNEEMDEDLSTGI